MAKLISDESGIKSTRELGKYFGMPILQKRINKETFGEILEKVNSRLSGWKGRFLSFAGRLTLTKAVLLSIPVHTMSTICLPKHTLDKLDQVSRSFLWGSTPEKKKQHLMAWKRICAEKREGGLGLRSASAMNKALLAKVGWRLLHDRSSLWAKVIRQKYIVGEIKDQSWLVAKSNWSSTWRSVGVGLREVVVPGLSWVLGNGRMIRFWKDKWLSDKPLLEGVTGVLSDEEAEVFVHELWRNGTGWEISRILLAISHHTRLQLAAVVLDNVTGAKDRISWGETSYGSFTVKSAYTMLVRDDSPRPCIGLLFDRIWRAVVPERVKLFLWLVVHQVIMTNVERYQRYLGNTSLCQVCRSSDETIIHVLRDCPAMSRIWTRRVLQRRTHEFFRQSLLGWIFVNLGDSTEVEGTPRVTRFAMAVWWGWKWRCGNVFGVIGKCRDRVRFIKEQAKEVFAAHLVTRGRSNGGEREERMIAWKPPGEGWVKLNTDGASHGNPGLATAGGVLRDGDGTWCGGFALNIGICSAPQAELWGVYYGLFIAWERGIMRLELEVDSKMVVEFLTTGISDAHPLSFLVRLCYGFLSKDWIVRISHVYREANLLADGLANYAFSLPLSFHLFDTRPDDVSEVMLEDARGSAYPRSVRM